MPRSGSQRSIAFSEESDAGDLRQVGQRLAPVLVAQRERPRERQVPLDELVTRRAISVEMPALEAAVDDAHGAGVPAFPRDDTGPVTALTVGGAAGQMSEIDGRLARSRAFSRSPASGRALGCGSWSAEPRATSARASSEALGRDEQGGGDRRRRAAAARLAAGADAWVAPTSRATISRLFEGADAVIHLAWLIQPSRDAAELERVNVTGSRRVFEAAAESGAKALVHASSVGAYSPGPKDRAVDESWPRDGRAELVLLAPQGGGGARRWTSSRPRRPTAHRAAAPRADLQARGGAGDPAPVRRAAAARPARCVPG